METAVQTLLAWKLWIVAGWFATILLCEHTLPIRRPRHQRLLKRAARNLSLFGLNGIASPLLVLYTAFVAESFSLGWRGEGWQVGTLPLICDLILIDAFIYWWHRANHAMPFLWRFHEIHHLDVELDSTTGVRFHLGEVVLSALVRSVFVIALDIPLTSVLVAEIMLLLASLFQHANLRLPRLWERRLGYLLVTPQWHEFHHRARRQDTDSNYGNLLSLWDRLFSSANPQRTPASVGIGVERRGDMPLLALLLAPFYRKRSAVPFRRKDPDENP